MTRLDTDTGFCCSLLGVSKACSDILGIGPEFLLNTQELEVKPGMVTHSNFYVNFSKPPINCAEQIIAKFREA